MVATGLDGEADVGGLRVGRIRLERWAVLAVLIVVSASWALPGWPQQKKAVARTTQSIPPDVQAALALEQQGKAAEAEAAWRKVVQRVPCSPHACAQGYAHLGLLEARQEHYAEAIADYRKAQKLSVQAHAPIAQLSLNLGLALFKSGNFAEAAQEFAGELKRNPKAADATRLTMLAGMAHYGARQYGAAIPYLKEAAAADKRNLPLRLNLAHCYLWTKQLDATLDVYREILTIDPDSAEADMIAGEALDEKGDNAGAVQQFRDAVKANPKEPQVHFGLAYLLWAQKRYDEAIPEFKAELANDPGNSQAMIYLGDTYVKQNQFELGKAMLEQALQLKATEPLIHLDLGIAAMETGDQAEALRELGRTVELEPDNVTAHFRLAKVYQQMGKRDEAKVEFAKASSLNKKVDEGLHKRIADANARPAPAASAAPEKP